MMKMPKMSITNLLPLPYFITITSRPVLVVRQCLGTLINILQFLIIFSTYHMMSSSGWCQRTEKKPFRS